MIVWPPCHRVKGTTRSIAVDDRRLEDANQEANIYIRSWRMYCPMLSLSLLLLLFLSLLLLLLLLLLLVLVLLLLLLLHFWGQARVVIPTNQSHNSKP